MIVVGYWVEQEASTPVMRDGSKAKKTKKHKMKQLLVAILMCSSVLSCRGSTKEIIVQGTKETLLQCYLTHEAQQ